MFAAERDFWEAERRSREIPSHFVAVPSPHATRSAPPDADATYFWLRRPPPASSGYGQRRSATSGNPGDSQRPLTVSASATSTVRLVPQIASGTMGQLWTNANNEARMWRTDDRRKTVSARSKEVVPEGESFGGLKERMTIDSDLTSTRVKANNLNVTKVKATRRSVSTGVSNRSGFNSKSKNKTSDEGRLIQSVENANASGGRSTQLKEKSQNRGAMDLPKVQWRRSLTYAGYLERKLSNQPETVEGRDQMRRFYHNRSRTLEMLESLLGVNVNTEMDETGFPTKTVYRPRKLEKSQTVAVDRLARSKYRRDPIKERLLFLTGSGTHEAESPDYVDHLDRILQNKHHEKESDRIRELSEIERDREWLWAVKYDLDFSKMEQVSLAQNRVMRAEAEEAEQNRLDAMFSSAGKNTFYTIANRTYGLDKMRDVDGLRRMHTRQLEDGISKGLANPRCTWQLHTLENQDEAMKELIDARTTTAVYLASQKIVEDSETLEDQKEAQDALADAE